MTVTSSPIPVQPGARGAQAVLLDAGGVLLLPNPYAVAAVVRAAGGSLDPDVVRRGHYAGMAAMDARRSNDWTHYYRVLVRFAAVPIAAIDEAISGLRELYSAPVPSMWSVLAPGVAESLEAFRAAGLGLAVVSNADGLVEEALHRCGVHIDVVVDSTVVGFSKPEPEIFAIALKSLGVSASDAVHIGDMASADVDGAHAAGVRALHLDPFGDCLYPRDHHEHVTSLTDVAALLVS